MKTYAPNLEANMKECEQLLVKIADFEKKRLHSPFRKIIITERSKLIKFRFGVPLKQQSNYSRRFDMFQRDLLSQRLLTLRKVQNISQAKLADIIGVSYHTICKIENKKAAASIEVLYALADHFNVSIDYLVGRDNKPCKHE